MSGETVRGRVTPTNSLRAAALALLLWMLPPAAVAALPSGLSVYSNICTERESGDILGYRVILASFGGTGETVLLQYGAGPLSPWLNAVVLDKRDRKLTFQTNTDEGIVRFRGVQSRNAISGEIAIGDRAAEHVRLARQSDIRPLPPTCR